MARNSIRIASVPLLSAMAQMGVMNLHLYDTSVYPNAVCNDGSPSGFYFRASSSQSNTWIVHQQGGDWCYSESSCYARMQTSPALVSSKTWPPTRNATGLLNSTVSPLADANVVYAMYCSSDAWVGNAPSSTVGFNFSFHMQGGAIVEALMRTLVTQYGMTSQPGAQLLYSGCSAGARGVTFELPRVPQLLSSISTTPISKFGALLDSMFWLDILPDPQAPGAPVPFATEVQGVFALINSSSLLNPLCTRFYTGSEQWKCMMGQYTLPFILESLSRGTWGPMASGAYFHSFLYDAYQLGHDWGLPFGKVPNTTEEYTYADAFRNDTLLRAQQDVLSLAVTGVSGTLPACFKHCNTEASTWATLTTQGVPLEQAVADWFSSLGSPAQQPVFYADSCLGFNCGPGCPAVHA